MGRRLAFHLPKDVLAASELWQCEQVCCEHPCAGFCEEMFGFVRNCHTAFHSGRTVCGPTSSDRRPCGPHPRQRLVSSAFWIWGNPTGLGNDFLKEDVFALYKSE